MIMKHEFVIALLFATTLGVARAAEPEGGRVRGRRLAAGRQPAGLRPDRRGRPPAELPGRRPDRRRASRSCSAPSTGSGSATTARSSSARRWPRRPAPVPSGSPSTRCTSTTPRHCDFSTDRLLAEHGINREVFDADFARDVIARAAAAVRDRGGEGEAGHAPGAGPGRGREGGVEPPDPRPRRQGQARPLHRLQRPGDPRPCRSARSTRCSG